MFALLAIAWSIGARRPDAAPSLPGRQAAGSITGVVLSEIVRPGRSGGPRRASLVSEMSIARAIVTTKTARSPSTDSRPRWYSAYERRKTDTLQQLRNNTAGQAGQIVLSRGETRSITVRSPRGSVVAGRMHGTHQVEPVQGIPDRRAPPTDSCRRQATDTDPNRPSECHGRSRRLPRFRFALR